jgi:hypothetical protein
MKVKILALLNARHQTIPPEPFLFVLENQLSYSTLSNELTVSS